MRSVQLANYYYLQSKLKTRKSAYDLKPDEIIASNNQGHECKLK